MIRLAIVLFLGLGTAAMADTLRLAVTTSFENSGLADVLRPQIEADLDIDLQVLVVGTGQALRLGQAGDVDAVLVHSRAAEEAFVAEGHATHRREIMYNDFVLVGPSNDPARIAEATSATDAFIRIATRKAPFVSRGDDSGTHKAERTLWAAAATEPAGPWYRPVGAGMGAALNTSSAMGAYVLADRASWLKFGNKGDLSLLFSSDPALFNQYAYLPVSPDKSPAIRHDLALQLEAWLTSEAAKMLIDGYRIDGQQLFFFNATRP